MASTTPLCWPVLTPPSPWPAAPIWQEQRRRHFTGDDLSRLLDARALALRTRKIIKENFAWSIGYNLLVLPLAASGWLPPYVAAAGMSLSSLIVVTNSMRLNR